MYQILKHILEDQKDNTKIRLIYGNKHEGDVICGREIDGLRKKFDNVTVLFLLDRPPEGWTEGVGYLTKEMVHDNLFPASANPVNLLCGPFGMIKAAKKYLLELDHDKSRLLTF